jgi:glycosyltransferase involved in cell wall biosynthesis
VIKPIQREKCTILLPIRNGKLFIEQALENLLAMANINDEILIVNDGSTDETPILLRGFQNRDPRIVVLNLAPSGLVTALNRGLTEAANEFIARADVDDIYSLDRLNCQIELLQSDSAIGAVFSDYVCWSESEDNLGYIPSGITSSATKLSLVDAFRTPHPSVMFRKSAVLSVGGYQVDDFPAEDLGLWIRLSSKFELHTVALPLLRYRMNPDGISSSRQTEMKLKRDMLIADLDYSDLISRNIDLYSDLKTAYSMTRRRDQRLALHNLDLYLCIKRANFDSLTRGALLARLATRFCNPRILLAFLSLLHDRRRRKRAAKR